MKTADLIARLEALNPWSDLDWPERIREAATRLATLEAEAAAREERIAALERALIDCAAALEECYPNPAPNGQIARARATLAKEGQGHE
jgi:septal ring factor EnvC (AmiA/AmiB activator)